jgi:segregation and condensation protein B
MNRASYVTIVLMSSHNDELTQSALLSSEELGPAALSRAQLIESILFVASEAVTITQLAKALECTPAQVESALTELQASYQQRGIRLQRTGDQVQLVTAPEAASVVGRFLGVERSARLSNAALEVLAIIAYRQPLTKAQIEAIRGVDSSSALRMLLTRELISEQGRLETAGRPILYGTTPLFLQQFGLTSLAELPTIEGLTGLAPQSENGATQPAGDQADRPTSMSATETL